jgi:hypothetical protein
MAAMVRGSVRDGTSPVAFLDKQKKAAKVPLPASPPSAKIILNRNSEEGAVASRSSIEDSTHVRCLISKPDRTLQHRASSIEHRASSIEHRASSIERRGSVFSCC